MDTRAIGARIIAFVNSELPMRCISIATYVSLVSAQYGLHTYIERVGRWALARGIRPGPPAKLSGRPTTR